MKLNMKAGELGVIIMSSMDINQIGKIVRCIDIGFINGEPYWTIEKTIHNKNGIPYWAVYDKALRPIRDSDGADETLAWAGKPETIVTDKEIA